ncbi:restriction endonuclease subunit S [Tessaracoccus palaemonis]|uniref:Restriction endonuclease subunit S n=1 Tax=Tessaracoccus palaemonis TaxID=2829499 RepID=A0ABX8SKN4_9ACTN|nr:restriction endonuclease subunit S [Tessaracoccus palaemonis]QXT63205.1 restriction endonuclease subunit S [Tessaracoccus palaemonis]
MDQKRPGADLPLLSVSQTRGVLRRDELSDRPPRAESLDHYKTCQPGDIVFNKMSVRAGAMGEAREAGYVTYHYEVMRPRPSVDPRFVVYLMKSGWFTGEMIRRERGIAAGDESGAVRTTEVPFRVLKTIHVPLIPPSEQRAIADFLDRETAQIDAFIAKNEQLITLLTERRASVVAQAVTKGLDCRAEMQSSEVDWFGQVPAHWSVSRLSRWFTVTLGKMLDAAKFETTDGEPLPYVRAANIRPGQLDLDSANQMPFSLVEQRRYSLRAGDLLVVEGGSIGVNVALEDDLPGWGFQKTVNRVRPRHDASAAFLGLQLDVMRACGGIEMIANVSTILHFTAEKLERTLVAMPPAAEQHAIVAHVRLSTKPIDEAIGLATEAIQLARERRAALISAAVTGKVDVGVSA